MQKIDSKNFLSYMESKLGTDVLSFLYGLADVVEVFVFSGIIRNYFLNYRGETRDFDIVVRGDINLIESVLQDMTVSRNSFGGYKTFVGSMNIDLWHIDNTWAYSSGKVEQLLFKEFNLPDTVFFNFSAITYDFRKEKFNYGQIFETFLATKELDLVLEENPYPQLCVINTIYYMQKFGLEVTTKLKDYCVKHFLYYTEDDFNDIQLRHFKEVKFQYSYLKVYMQIFKEQLLMQS